MNKKASVPRIAVIGAGGFVGSAFVRFLRRTGGAEVLEVTRQNYSALSGTRSDVVVDAAGNSKKYLADSNEVEAFDLSVTHRLRTLKDFPAEFHLHISSVDVYSGLSSSDTTRESTDIDRRRLSNYGLHKLLAEDLVRHHAGRWLILRLAGMVGEGLRKNPVFDILNRKPLFIHPDSQYQFMLTDEVARIGMMLLEKGVEGEVLNLCGDGLISPRQIANIAGTEPSVSGASESLSPRIVDVNLERIKRIIPIPETEKCITEFIEAWKR